MQSSQVLDGTFPICVNQDLPLPLLSRACASLPSTEMVSVQDGLKAHGTHVDCKRVVDLIL
jgi:hypothetical protein